MGDGELAKLARLSALLLAMQDYRQVSSRVVVDA